MNVLILSDHDREGGAAIATCRVEAALGWARCEFDPQGNPTVEHHLDRVVYFPEAKGNPAARLWYEESFAKRWLYRLPRKVLPGLFPHPHTPAFAARRLRDLLRQLRPDIISLHNLHAATPWGWGPHLVEVCLQFAPVVWTLHDMWSFTGRCAYSYDCEKFITGCDSSCPTPDEHPALARDKIAAAWEERRAIYARHRDDLVIVTPSQWLAVQARRGLFSQHRIEVIPYGLEWWLHPTDELFWLDSARFWSEDRRGIYISDHQFLEYQAEMPVLFHVPHDEAQRLLGIHPAGPVLLIAAVDLSERRKGAEILPQLWQHIEHRPLTILTMGRGELRIDDPLIEVHHLGYLDDPEKKAIAFCAADALLHPAPVDNFPNVVLEAFLAGTPAIAMPVGGLPEMIRPGVSGWLADAATPAALGRAVDLAIRDLWLGKNLRESSRTLAEKEYPLHLQGQRYFKLFKELLAGRKSRE